MRLSTLHPGATQLVVTVAGGTMLTSDYTFNTSFIRGTPDLLSITGTKFLSSRSSIGLPTMVTGLNQPWARAGIGVGPTGLFTFDPTLLWTFRDMSGATVGTLTIRGNMTGNFTASLAPISVAAVVLSAGNDALRAIAANGIAAPLLGLSADVVGTVTMMAPGGSLE